MAIIKAFTDLSRSKKLAEILPPESADMWWSRCTITDFGDGVLKVSYAVEPCNISQFRITKEDVPCWSLAALRNLLPPAIKPNKDSYLFLFESHNTFDKSWVYRYYNEDDTSYLYYKNTNEVDACVDIIIKLNELNLL